ncbi:MAG: PASTA domain-containing protein [Calditrichaeota bacterium]|nr:MAG: PASTA domain-containing protein [Calditrichota bacterium]
MFKKMQKQINRNRNRVPGGEVSSTRIMVLAIFFLVGFLLIGIKLFLVQVVEHTKYKNIARNHLEHQREIPAQRGTIWDRHHQTLAVDLIHFSLGVRPRLVQDVGKTARLLSRILDISYQKLLSRMKKQSPFVYVAHRLSPEKANEIRKLRLKGVVLEKRFSRYYPMKEIGAQVVGYCDFDNQAGAGLELKYDELLRGKPGKSIFLRDALGNQIPNLDFPTSDPINGMSLETTIDLVYQSILEEELKATVLSHKALSGSAVLLDPRTGEVLAMANYPGYDPNRYNQFPVDHYRNRAITDVYEPGSTFKMVTLAVALEAYALNLDKKIVNCENGKYRLGRKVISDHQPFKYLTARQAFERSSNIGIIKLAQKFSPLVFFRYARDFGFGTMTGIDLPAEASGILHTPDQYSKYSLSYMSIGYEVAATPLQIAAAYGAIANQGILMQPFVVRRILDDTGQPMKEQQPVIIRRVVKAETAEKMKEVLVGVVEHGTGHTAYLEGVKIAGKTGTAQKLDEATGSYTSNRHVAYFAGFFPADKPRFVLVVVVNSPRRGYYGSQVAAPAFKDIVERIIGLPGNSTPTEIEQAGVQWASTQQFLVPLEGMGIKTAQNILESRDLRYEIIGNGNIVYKQEPAAYSEVTEKTKVKLFTEGNVKSTGKRMPKLKGLTLREALQVLNTQDLTVKVEGSGIVYKQYPAPGTPISSKIEIKLVCKPS